MQFAPRLFPIYVVALFSWIQRDFTKFHLKLGNLLGYLGKTTLNGIDYDAFDEMTGKLELPYAFSLFYETISKENFNYFTDIEPEEMGFFVSKSSR
jgi:hypothetical protein